MELPKTNLCNYDEEPDDPDDDPRNTDIQEGDNRPGTGMYY